ncbi:hypothetical protein Agabi119p4_3363 [Agaricus bisporus var. burnettii]|uniref:Uncharacterized protein n=1 Tax=Agaricus bisporus var. burnettii TaxID=192524 RepID=A0A8H7KJ43_AGABI|nr:hypothetical protein Agabi119p4_3363 [Agaricus bisporus var. burnettii]
MATDIYLVVSAVFLSSSRSLSSSFIRFIYCSLCNFIRSRYSSLDIRLTPISPSAFSFQEWESSDGSPVPLDAELIVGELQKHANGTDIG